jgi:NAD(P)-dependent dehydrogenase (short-subunit alcohol dehydrogenase family)
MESLYPNVDIHVRSFDAADEKALIAVIDEAVAKYGRLDIFFANAGIVGQPKLFTEIDGDGFMNTMRTNALGYTPPQYVIKSKIQTNPLPASS